MENAVDLNTNLLITLSMGTMVRTMCKLQL